MYRLATQCRTSGKVFFSPFVYTEEDAEKRRQSLIQTYPLTKTIKFPVQVFPKLAVWKEEYYDLYVHTLFTALIRRVEKLWEEYNGV